jgi:hypothetical protein
VLFTKYYSRYEIRNGAMDGDRRSVMVGKTEGKSPLAKCRRRWEGNIKMELQEEGGTDCKCLVQVGTDGRLL